jgi:hypothetical protein
MTFNRISFLIKGKGILVSPNPKRETCLYAKSCTPLLPKTVQISVIKGEIQWSGKQGSRKLAPLAPPVPDKSHLVGQNEIKMREKFDILWQK